MKKLLLLFTLLVFFASLGNAMKCASTEETIKLILVTLDDDTFTRSVLKPFTVYRDAVSRRISFQFHWNIGEITVRIVEQSGEVCFTDRVATEQPDYLVDFSLFEQGNYSLEIFDQSNRCWRGVFQL